MSHLDGVLYSVQLIEFYWKVVQDFATCCEPLDNSLPLGANVLSMGQLANEGT